jgi:hypothetical protein
VSVNECLARCPSLASNAENAREVYSQARADSLVLIAQVSAATLALTAGYVLLQGSAPTDSPPTPFILGVLFVLSAVILGTLYVPFSRQRRLARIRLAAAVLALTADLEMNAAEWRSPRMQRHTNRQIELCGRLFEQLPVVYGAYAVSSSKAAVAVRAQRIAQHFRSYAIWLAFPQDFTFTDLVHAFAGAFHHLANGTWFEIPGDDYTVNIRANRRERIALGAVACVLFAGLLVLSIFQSRLGIAGSLASSIVAIVIVLILGRMGLNFTTLQQAANAAAAAGTSAPRKA